MLVISRTVKSSVPASSVAEYSVLIDTLRLEEAFRECLRVAFVTFLTAYSRAELADPLRDALRDALTTFQAALTLPSML
jgi:hypothetical protein